MTTYRVEVDGVTVWTDETDGYQGAQHFGEYLNRPSETADGEPNPSAIYLYVDNGGEEGEQLIGVQRSHDDERAECEAAADTLAAAGDAAGAEEMRIAAAEAALHARRTLLTASKEG